MVEEDVGSLGGQRVSAKVPLCSSTTMVVGPDHTQEHYGGIDPTQQRKRDENAIGQLLQRVLCFSDLLKRGGLQRLDKAITTCLLPQSSVG